MAILNLNERIFERTCSHKAAFVFLTLGRFSHFYCVPGCIYVTTVHEQIGNLFVHSQKCLSTESRLFVTEELFCGRELQVCN